MKLRYILALAAAFLAATPATAQVCTYTEQNGATKNCIKVALDTATTGTGTGAMQVQGPQADGAAPVGNPVVSAGYTGTVVKRIKVDTDGAQFIYGTRKAFVNGVFGANVLTVYTQGTNVGGLVTISTGLGASTVLESCRITVRARSADVTTSAGLTGIMMNANPTGSTIADNTAVTLAAADLSKVQFAGVTATTTLAATPVLIWAYTCPRMTTDASGNLYFMVSAGTGLVLAATPALQWAIEITY